jgi:hypothetical protein
MIAGVGWLGLAVVVAMNAGKGGDKALLPQMLLALVAFASGGYVWHVYYGARFDAPQKVLAFGVLCAVAAAGVQGMMVGAARRKRAAGLIADETAQARFGRAHQVAAGLLVVTLCCMGVAAHL